jgi:hypothetical protein
MAPRKGAEPAAGLDASWDSAAALLRSPLMEVPHFGQKANSGAQRYPHPAHCLGCFIPQAGQKAKPRCISAPQPAQFINQRLEAARRDAIPMLDCPKPESWPLRLGAGKRPLDRRSSVMTTTIS